MTYYERSYRKPKRYERELCLIEQPIDWALRLLETQLDTVSEKLGYWLIRQWKKLYEAMYHAVFATEQYIIRLAKRK